MAYKLDIMLGTSLDKTELKKVETQLDALYSKYSTQKKIKLGTVSGESSSSLDKVNGKLDTFEKKTTTAGDATKTLDGRMKTAIRSTIEWTVAVGGLYAVINKLKDSVQFTTDFDRSLTEIAMVTGQTRDEVAELKDEYLALGEAIKVSSLELSESAVALYRQGLSAQEVNDRLSEISKTAKVAGLSVLEVTTYVTSGVNAMKVSAQEFNDIVLKIGSISATDYQKISTALTKSAASFKIAGYDLETAGASLAVVTEVTQESAESIGSSFKTILARFNKVNELGEDNTAVLNTIGIALKSVGIEAEDMDGQLRPASELIDELGGKWSTLDGDIQKYLTTQIAGVRQGNRFLVLMDNYNRMLEIQSGAYEATGTTQEQYLKFQESIEGKLSALTVAWEKFYDSMLDEETISNAIDLLTSLVDGLTELSDEFGIVTLAVFGLMTYLSVSGKLATALPMIQSLGVGVVQLAKSFGLSTGAALSLGTAVAAIAPIAVLAGVILAFKGIKTAIDNAYTSYEEYNDKIEESRLKIVEMQSELEKLKNDEISKNDVLISQLQKRLDLEEDYLNLISKKQAIQSVESGALSVNTLEKATRAIEDYNNQATYKAELQHKMANLTEANSDKEEIYNDAILGSTEIMRDSMDTAEDMYNRLLETKEILGTDFPIAAQNTIVKLEDLLGISIKYQDILYGNNGGIKTITNSIDNLEDSVEDTTYSIGTLTQYLRDYIAEGENTEAMVTGLKEDQDVLNQIFDMTEGELISLAYQYGMSMEDIAKFNTEATDIVLEETKLRLSAMQAEKEALESNYLNNPEARAYLTLLDDDINASLNKIDELQARTDWDFTSTDLSTTTTDGGGTDSATQSLSAYFDQLNKIREAQEEISRLEAKEGADGVDLTEEKVEQYKKLQIVYSEYHDLLDLEKGKLESIVLTGDDEVERLERIEELESLIIGTSTNWLTTQSSINDLMNTSTEIAEEQLDLQKEQEEALSIQKEAVEDLIDLEENRIKQALEDQIDDLEKQIDLQNELVDAVKDKLALEKESADYNDSISDKQEEELALQKKIDILRNDPTQVGAVTEFEDDLDDIREDIADERADREYDVRVDTLDKELEVYEDSKDNEIDVLKAQLDKDGELRAQAIKNISDAIKDEGSVLYDELVAWNNEYGTSIESDIATAWDLAKNALSGYVDVLSGMGGIDANIERSQKIQEMMENSQAWFDASPDERIRLENANMEMGTSLGWTREKGAWYDEDGIRAFGNGGHLTSPEVILAGDESESIIPDIYMGKFLADAYNNISGMMNYGSITPEYSTSSNTTTNSPSFIINIKGNADKSTISKIQRAGSNMIQDFYKKGQNRPVQALG